MTYPTAHVGVVWPSCLGSAHLASHLLACLQRLLPLLSTYLGHTILQQLTWHAREKLEPIACTLEARLSHAALWCLCRLLRDFDAANERFQELDDLVGHALEPWERELDLLQMIPGVVRSSTHAILGELGPEPAKVFPDAASLAAWAGVCPGQRECQQTSFRLWPRGECGPAGHPDGVRPGSSPHARLAVPRLPRQN